jgi:hypothetical protein
MKYEYSKQPFVSPYYMTLRANRTRQYVGYTARPVDLTLNWGNKKLRTISRPLNFGVLNHHLFNPFGDIFQKSDSKQVSLEEAKEMVRQGLLIVRVNYIDDPTVAA